MATASAEWEEADLTNSSMYNRLNGRNVYSKALLLFLGICWLFFLFQFIVLSSD